MYAGQDFSPAETVDNELFGIDFVNDLSKFGAGEQITSVVFLLGVVSGNDPNPQSHLVDAPYVTINPYCNSGLVTMAVQRISGLLTGVQYWLQADAMTTNSNTLSLWARIPPEPPPVIWNPAR